MPHLSIGTQITPYCDDFGSSCYTFTSKQNPVRLRAVGRPHLGAIDL